MIIFYINFMLNKEGINRDRLYLILPNFDYLKFLLDQCIPLLYSTILKINLNDPILVENKLSLKIKILLQ